MFALIGLYLVFALSFTMSKGVLLHASPVFFTGVRMIIAGIMLLGYHTGFKGFSLRFKREDIWLLMQLAFFHVFVTYVFEFWALETVSASTDALFFNLTSFITALLSLVLCKERLSMKQWMGLCVGFIGFLPLFYAQQTTCTNSIIESLSCFSFSKAELLLFTAVTASSYGWIVMQKLVRNDRYSPVLVNGMSMLVGGLLALIVAFFTESTFILRTPGSSPHYDLLMCFWYMAVLIVLTNFITYNMYGLLLRRYSATFMALAGSMTPLFTAFFDWLLFGEVITWHFVATALLVFVGLFVFYSDELKQATQQTT